MKNSIFMDTGTINQVEASPKIAGNSRQSVKNQSQHCLRHQHHHQLCVVFIDKKASLVASEVERLNDAGQARCRCGAIDNSALVAVKKRRPLADHDSVNNSCDDQAVS